MPYDLTVDPIWCECSCCGLRVDGEGEIERLFGWRTPNDSVIPQSYCRACRSAHCETGKPCKFLNK